MSEKLASIPQEMVDGTWRYSPLKTFSSSQNKYHLFEKPERTYAHNALVPATEYTEVTWRSLDEICYILGPDLKQFIRSLKLHSNILLPGGGYGIYGLELANLGHHVTCINAQDFYKDGQLARILLDQRVMLTESMFVREKRVFYTIGKVPINVFNRLAQVVQVPFPKSIKPPVIHKTFPRQNETWELVPGATERLFFEEFETFFGAIIKKVVLQEHKPLGSFCYFVNFVQGCLHRLRRQTFDLIIDVMDAYTYSSDRINLLNSYYSKLAPGGRAYICIEGQHDIVHLAGSTIQQQDQPPPYRTESEHSVLFNEYLLATLMFFAVIQVR